MSQKPNGGPVFPGSGIVMEPDVVNPETGDILSWTHERRDFTGMTLRDWFAGQALARLPYDPKSNFDVQAVLAYRMADAMIAERDK